MNKLPGIIQSIESHQGVSIVNIESGTIMLKSVVLQDDSMAKYLKVGNAISVLFKETEVIIVKSDQEISLRNRIRAVISKIDKGKLLSQLELSFEEGIINSIITTNAVESLDLKEGMTVYAMIKTNEIIIAE